MGAAAPDRFQPLRAFDVGCGPPKGPSAVLAGLLCQHPCVASALKDMPARRVSQRQQQQWCCRWPSHRKCVWSGRWAFAAVAVGSCGYLRAAVRPPPQQFFGGIMSSLLCFVCVTQHPRCECAGAWHLPINLLTAPPLHAACHSPAALAARMRAQQHLLTHSRRCKPTQLECRSANPPWCVTAHWG